MLDIRVFLPFATPSLNQWQSMHWSQRKRFSEACARVVRAAIQSHAPNLYATAVPDGFCSYPGCREQSLIRDERKCSWCKRHAGQWALKPERRHLTVVRCSAGVLDDDNLRGGCKGLVDALVRVGLLYDDKPKYLEAEYYQETVPRGQGRTVVRVRGALPTSEQLNLEAQR